MAKRTTPINEDTDALDLEDQISALNDNEPETVSTGPSGGYAVPKSNPNRDPDLALNGKRKNPVKMLLVTVSRDASSAPATWIHDYELEVLKEIHAESLGPDGDGLTVVREKDGYTTMNAAEAHAQLLIKYSAPESKAAVLRVYRTPKALADESNLPWNRGDELSAKRQQAQEIDHAEEAEKAAAAANQNSGEQQDGASAE